MTGSGSGPVAPRAVAAGGDRIPRERVLAVVTGVLGLAGAAVWAVMALLHIADAGLNGDHGPDMLWVAIVVALAVAQGWGAVRLLRRRGWALLALGSLPGVLPVLVLGVLWTEYRQEMTSLDVLAALPALPLVLVLLPPVRRWATPRPPAARADHGAMTSSGA